MIERPSVVRLRSLRQALVVAEQLSFSRAAAVLGVQQSSVSRSVRVLEDEIGVSLFERSRRGVRLTTAGAEFLRTAQTAICELDYGLRRASSAGKGSHGWLRIGIFASVAHGFPYEAVRIFRERHPSVTIEIVEGAPRDHLLRLRAKDLDVALLTGTPTAEGLQVEQLWSESVALALPTGHSLATAEEIGWSVLRGERFIVSREEPGPEIHEWLIARLASLGHHPDIVRHNVSRETLLVMVGLNFGLTVVSEAATGATYPNVLYRILDRDKDAVPFCAVWSAENDNPPCRRFLALLQAMAKGRRLPPSSDP